MKFFVRLFVLVLVAMSVPAMSVAAIATAQPARSTPTKFLDISIGTVTPSSVTTSSPSTVTVTGSVRNIGDRAVSDVSVRLQRSEPVTAPEQLRTALTLDQDRFDTVGTFDVVADTLERNESVDFTLMLPLRSRTEPSLDITAPGVFPMLVNVNGVPDYGQEARLDDARFLLPVTGVPRDESVTDPADPTAAAVPPDTARPVALSVMWPLADRPSLVAGLPGSLDAKVRLVDDDLASSLAPGGRLDGLVTALEFATGSTVDLGGELARSVCIAIDPDLLITVSNMTRGYLVADDPADPMGPAHDGAGTAVAQAWLDRVESLASTMCVTSLPFAQTDLASVTAVGDASLTDSALTAPTQVIDTILGIDSRSDVVWPDSGVLDTATADLLRSRSTGSPTTALLAEGAVTAPADTDVVTLGGGLDAALFDPAIATSLAAVGDAPTTPSFTPRDQVYDLANDSSTARLQDALGALSWLALTPTSDRARTAIIAPPQAWTATPAQAAAVLGTISSLMRSGLATSRPISALTDADSSITAVLNYPEAATADAPSDAVRTRVAELAARMDSLESALVDDPTNGLTPRLYMNPLREDLLRAMTTHGRRGAGLNAANDAATARVAATKAELDAIASSVTVLAPGGVFTLASEQSPLLLVARNDLPVGINVRLAVDAPPSMEVDDIGPTILPPRGSRSLQVPARVSDSQKLVVTFGLTTADGTKLGDATSVNVRSNAYGRALAIITGVAGALLLLLAGRRLWHRFRGQPDPADDEGLR